MPTAFDASGIWGAGFCNSLGCNADGSVVVVGGDVHGTHYSLDKGDLWITGQRGYFSTPMRETAGLAFSVLNPDHVYSASSHGLLKSEDKGLSWVVKTTAVKFEGGNIFGSDVYAPAAGTTPERHGLPAKHPRSTGNLIAMATVEGTTWMWLASFKSGVWRNSGSGVTQSGGDTSWTSIGPTAAAGSAYYARSLVYDAATDRLFAAFYNSDTTYSGVWFCVNPRDPTPTWDKFTGNNAPLFPEELKVIGSQLYCVGNSAASTVQRGVSFVFTNVPEDQAWTQLNTGLDLSSGPPHLAASGGPYWESIDGYVPPGGGAHVLFIGCAEARNVSGVFKNIMRSVDGGATWTNITATASAVDSNIPGTTTAPIAVTNKALTSNVATVTTGVAHGYTIGNTITVAGVDATFNGSYVITSTPTPTTVSYARTAANVASTAVSPAGSATMTVRWWHYDDQPSSMIHKGAFVAAELLLDPSTVPQTAGDGRVPRLWVAGRAGVWRTNDALAAVPQWKPLVQKLDATIGTTVAVDPQDDDKVYSTNTDWIFFQSTDRWKNITQRRPSGVTGTTKGLDIAFDMSGPPPSRIYLSAANRDADIAGEVYSKAWNATSWRAEGLNPLTGGKHPVGIGVGRDAAGQVILLAAVGMVKGTSNANCGIWRKVGTAWDTVGGVPAPVHTASFQADQVGEYASWGWWWGRAVVYVFDRQSGIWRSTNYGAAGSWTNIWPSARGAKNVGYIDVDPTDERLLWVSKADGLYKLSPADTGAAVGSGITATRQSVVLNPGAMRVSRTGVVACTDRPTNATEVSKVWKSANDGATWENVADATYERVGWQPAALDINGPGDVFVLSWGTGGYRGVVTTSPLDTIKPSVPGNPTATLDTSGAAPRINVAWTASTDESGIKGYDVYRSTNAAAFSVVNRVLAGTTYPDTSVSPGSTYRYYIVAIDASSSANQSDPSATTTAVEVTQPSTTSAGGRSNLRLGRMKAGGAARPAPASSNRAYPSPTRYPSTTTYPRSS